MRTETGSQDVAKVSYYVHWTKESVRYNDTDRQGHVNNAVFVTFLEAGRVSLLYNPKEEAPTPEGTSFVLANLVLNFRGEILWPSEVRIGTTVSRIGNSSVTFCQGLFCRRQLCRDSANRLGSHRQRNAQVAALAGSNAAGVEKMAESKREWGAC